MAQNGGYYHGQSQPVQPPQPQYQQVYQQPQNIYQQLGKPQPQQHLQGHPNYAHPSPQGQGFQISQPQYANQQPGQYQQPYQPSQTPYQQQQAPYTASHTPFLPSRTPFAPPPPQPSPFIQAQVPYQVHQTPYVPAQPVYQQQPPLQQQYAPVQSQPLQGQQSTIFSPNNLPTSSFPNHTPSALSNPAGPVSRPLSTFRPPPVSPSASLAQQVQSHTHPVNQIPAQQSQIRPPPQQTIQRHSPISSQPQRPQVQTSVNPTQGPLSAQGSPTKVPATPTSSSTRRPLPQPSPGANAKPPTLPPVMQRVPNLAAFASSSPGTSTPPGSATNKPIIATTFNKPFPAAASQDLQSVPSERRTPSPTRNSRPLPNPGSPNKRATIDLGKPSSSGFSYVGNSTSGSNSPTKSGFAALPTPPSLGSPSKSTDNSRNVASTPGSSRTSIYSVNRTNSSTNTATTSGATSAPKRRASPPRFTPNSASQPGSSSSSPVKESTPSTWGKLNSNPTPALTQARNAALSSGSGSAANPPQMVSQSYPLSSATMANATEGSSKKFTPMWKRTIPEVPAPVWGFAAGMVSEPHPKPRAQPTTAATPSTVQNSGISPTKNGGNKLMKKRKSVSTSPVKGVPQTSAHNQRSPPKQQVYYQQPLSQTSQYPAPSSYARGASAYNSGAKLAARRRNQPETSTEEEETEETEEDGEEEETTEEDEDEGEDPRYHIPSRRAQPQPPRMEHRRHYSQPLANDDEERRKARTRSHSRGRQAYSQDQYEYDQEDEEEDDETPRKAAPRARKVLRLKDRVDPYAGYEDISPIGSSRGLKNIRPKALDAEEEGDDGYGNTPRKRILRRDEVEIPRKNDRGSSFVEKGESVAPSSKSIRHQRSLSAIEEREMQIRNARKNRQGPDKERSRPGSAFARRKYDDEDDEDEDEDSGLAYDDEDQEDRSRGNAKAKNQRERRQPSSLSYGIRDIPPANANRRTANASSNSNRYDNEQFDDESNHRPSLPSRGRPGLPEPPSMSREDYGPPSGSGMDHRSQGAPRWKTSTTSLKYDNSAEEDQRRRFEAMNINAHGNHPHNNRSDSRMSGMSIASGTSAGSGAWPQDLPRLPRTPGSANTPGSAGYHDSQTGYFDHAQPQQSNFSERQRRSQSQGPPTLPSRNGSSSNNLYLDDPPPQASVMRTPSPGPTGGFTFQKRPQSQTFDHRSSDSHPPNLPRRPQSQIYGNPNAQQQPTPFHQRQPPPPQHPRSRGLGGQSPGTSSHLGFGQQQRQQPQTPAPPPTIGIESPYPVGGREKMADIPKMEIDSEHGSDHESARRSPGMVPSINIEPDVSGPSRSRSQSIPAIHIDSSPQIKHHNSNVPMINIDRPPAIKVNGSSRKQPPREVDDRSTGPRTQVFEVPGVSVSGPGFDDWQGGPVINVSGPDDHNQRSQSQHNHNQRPPSHASSYGSGYGQQPRSGGLFCGGCNNAITNGRIVSAMGARWHPSCFKCTVCSTLLEHVSSFEHEGRPYCHLDYHESFAPRCYSCKTAIIDEQFISLDDPALGKRTYHTQHFFCSECGDPFLDPSAPLSTDANGELALTGDGDFEGFTVYKGYPYCEACHVRLRLPKCKRCKKAIRDHEEAVEALGGKWCWGCFTCAGCENPFENPSFFQRDDKPYCEQCFSIILRNEV
ncbi:hypothetical protein CPB83DRAFT_905514 [Crepidotus variabilis]|uniref:LIM zinc-binding domain-containing protein n=1 Tax=Crepidotus variabilis TaxID=179855 RepID=A0A9P6EJU2_9AGAR|nr:hypothetical protein CPB83DRAFT_905514 [Crepidotus variabilis]